MAFRLDLCRNGSERARLLDVSRRLRVPERWLGGLFLLVLASGIPTFGWAYLAPIVLALALFWVVKSRLDRFRRPELPLAGAWLLLQVSIAVSVALASGPRLFLLPLFIAPMLFAATAFPGRPVAIGALLSFSLMALTGLALEPKAVLEVPFWLMGPGVVLLGATIPAAAARAADVASRGTAVVDQLTGMLNRVALEARAMELAYQSAATSEQVSMIVADVDSFRSINDRLGHAGGDAVLKEVAYRLRKTLGAFEPAYRFGGDEFVIVLTGADEARAMAVAESFGRAVRAVPVLDETVTMSFGVAASTPGEPFDFEATFGRADAALYEAKHAGRDCVRAQVQAGAPSRTVVPIASAPESHRRRSSDQAQPQQAAPQPAGSWRERVAAEHRESGSWLLEDDLQREHLLDLNRRLHQSNLGAYLLAFGYLLTAAIAGYGWLMLLPPMAGAVVYNAVERRLDRFRRPEYPLGVAWLVAQAGNAGAYFFVNLNGDAYPPYFSLCLMLLMVVGSSAVFSRRGIAIGVGFTIGATLVAAAGLGSFAQVASMPVVVALPLALIVIAGVIGATTGRSAVEHRGAAVVDGLTGMLNRAALEARVAEVTHQAGVISGGVAVIVADLDRFKSVNDEHGHAAGDAVLQGVAGRLRGHLRAFESAYRFGGEEFVVLLPGVSEEAATVVAEHLREAVKDGPVAGVPVTVSLGLAVSDPGEPFVFEATFERADAALYEAKHGGRDRVCVAAGPVPEALAA